MKKMFDKKIFNLNAWFLIMFILLVGAFAVAYIDMRKDLILLREAALQDVFE